jgi:S-adenosylmethionine:tRNA ribosyltransferase-isomerase
MPDLFTHNLNAYTYDLPPERIAVFPTEARNASKMLVFDRVRNSFEHRLFNEIVDFIPAGDLVVFNDVKVQKARLTGSRKTGGKLEIMVLGAEKKLDGFFQLELLISPSRRIKTGETLFAGRDLKALTIVGRNEEVFTARLSASETEFASWLEKNGEMPIPPYLRRSVVSEIDNQRYQTIYAASGFGSAAPTAGLHFTSDILTALTQKGVELAYLTLNVGRGTFLPIRTSRIDEHQMHREQYRIPVDSWKKILRAKKNGSGIWAVGTTTVRALESFGLYGETTPGSLATNTWLSTRLFITPGFVFKQVDHLLTNFHQPKSSLFVMLAAACGLPRLQEIYAEALSQKYRMLSYGDSMLVI